MDITLDIAALLGAIMWPVAILVLLLAFRKSLPSLADQLAGRVTKLGIAGISLELAEAKPFVPQWSGASNVLDLRSKATAVQINDSTHRMFVEQLRMPGGADFAEVNLGEGEEWLTSRLYIMAILFARMKGVRAFVFLETAQGVRRRYVGWATADTVRWTLAQRYPWLETAFADAYSHITRPTEQGVVVLGYGRLGLSYQPDDVQPAISLLREYLTRVQQLFIAPMSLPDQEKEWVLLDPADQTYEHASWVSSELLEDVLGNFLNTTAIRQSQLLALEGVDQLRMVTTTKGEFIALTADDGRFQELLERCGILEQATGQLIQNAQR